MSKKTVRRHRPTRKAVLIFTNGQRTEMAYLKKLKSLARSSERTADTGLQTHLSPPATPVTLLTGPFDEC